jgi:hypothetical protein
MLRFFVAVERLPPAVVDDRLRLFVVVERQAPYNIVQPEPEQALHRAAAWMIDFTFQFYF